jgi:hypothetical protein
MLEHVREGRTFEKMPNVRYRLVQKRVLYDCYMVP